MVRIRTPITDMLGIEHPVLLAPMGSVSGGRLAAAVSRAGGLGIIGGGYCDPAWLDQEIQAAGNAQVGIGFITWALQARPAVLDTALAHAPKAIILSFGELQPLAGQIKRRGVRLIAQVQSVAQARQAVAEGADILVAQGSEAGGHGATRATLPLVPAVIDAVPGTPVIAAGGIADGRGLAAALMLGAAGVLCGTAFYASEEALADPVAKQTLVQASGDQTQRSTVFDLARGIDWPQPWTIRTLENAFSRRWASDPASLQARLPEEQRRYAEARDASDFDTAAVIAGEAADLVRSIRPAAEILSGMVEQAAVLLRRGPSLLD
jgi:nitronate monooxygenase